MILGQVITVGDYKVTLTDGDVVTPVEKKLIEKNSRAKNPLLMTIISLEFYLISRCETVKEIWDTLCETYEGTETIMDAKVNALLQRYELFKFK